MAKIDIENLKILRESLHPVHRKWYDIGLQLDIHPDSLDNIADNCNNDTSRSLLEMLKKWLKQVDPVPIWESVVKALEHCTVGEKHLASQLKEKYCNQQPPGKDECQPAVSPVSREARFQKLEEELKRKTDEIAHLKRKRSLDDRTDIIEVPAAKRDLGIDYIAKRHVNVSSSSGHSFELNDLGFKMCIPKGGLPPRQSEAKLTIKVSLSGQYTTGDSHELASAVYWVDSPVDFQKPVTIEIQHNAVFKDPSQPPPKFVTASNELPHSFSIVDGGEFSTSNQYGTIDVKSFSGWAIVVPQGTPQLYCSQLWYSKCSTLQPLVYTNSHKVFFSITKLLDAVVYAMRLLLDDVVPGPAIPLEFEDNKISMDISPEGFKRGGTEIIPRYPPVITKDEVDSFGCGGLYPVCELTVNRKLLSDYDQCTIRLIGAKAPHDYVILDLERAVMDSTTTNTPSNEEPCKEAGESFPEEMETDRKSLSEEQSFSNDQEPKLEEVVTDSTQNGRVADKHEVKSTHDVVEASSMKLSDEKLTPFPESPPETYSHSQPMHAQVTGYDVKLVKKSPDLCCPICLFVLRDPIQTNCCGKRFCRACIEVIMAEAKPCPACKCKFADFGIFEDKAKKQEILEVSVHCSNRKLGCGWKGELCQLDSHLNLDPKKGKMDLGCQYVQLKCIHCSEDCQRYHMRSCLQQPYTCPYCKHYSSTYENVSKYHYSECDEFPVQCTAIEMPTPVFITPPTFVMNNFTEYKEKRVSWVSPSFYSHIGGYKFCLSVDAHGLGECSGTHVSVYAHLQCGEYDDGLTWPFTGDITIQLVNQSRDEGHMERTLRFDEHTPAESTSRVTEDEQAVGWGYNDFMPNSALHYDEKWNTKYLNNDNLEFRITQVKLSKTAAGLPPETHEQHNSNKEKAEQPELPRIIPPVNIVMNNFITRKICGDSWFSPPFYSHAGGYKMCLSVHANGDKSGAGTHVSVFVRVMRGEYDDNLEWPFTGDITIQLVNQGKNQKHDIVETTVNFTPSANADRVTDGERGSGFGLFQFVSHSALYESSSPNLLKNDCLEFRITQVKLTTSLINQLQKAQSPKTGIRCYKCHTFLAP